MMIITGREEERATSNAPGYLQAKEIVIKFFRLSQITDVQIEMADICLGGHTRRDGVGISQRQQADEVQRPGNELHLSIPHRPLGSWAVIVKLNTISIWVGEMNRLAHAVVGCAWDWVISREQPMNRLRQIMPARISNRKMVKPGRVIPMGRGALVFG